MHEYRARTKLAPEALEQRVGKILLESDISLKVMGPEPVRILKPDGKPLAVYLPRAIPEELREASMPTLQELKGSYTSNRGLASGSERVKGASQRTYAKAVDSAIVGAFEAKGPKQFCRLTAWTGKETEKWTGLWPLFEFIGQQMKEHVPERWAAQMKQAAGTSPEWVIKGTPFTTITVNNTYETGVHTDKGDLHEGFSNVTCFRTGEYKGGWLCFPEYRVGVDMQDRDLLLMDAHEWHGNTSFDPKPKRKIGGGLDGDPGFERISIVCYYRTNMKDCGTAADELARAQQYAENRSAALVGE
jgi:hypothetical protein